MGEDLGTTKSVKMICITSLSRSPRSQRQRESQQRRGEDALALMSVRQLRVVMRLHSPFSLYTRIYAFFATNTAISTNISQQTLERNIE